LSALHALGGSAYDEEFITALSSELSFVAEAVDKLRLNRVTELTLRSLSRLELQQIFNITLNDAVMISAWCSARLKEEEKAERARLKEEEKAERARLKQQKLEQSKHLRIFNEADGEYSDISIPDQNSLQTYLSGSRISALRLVDASRTSSLLIMTWDSLVNNSCYAHPSKVREAIDVLTGELYKEEKRNAEHGSCRLLSSHFHTEFDYAGSDIKMKSKRGRDLGDIDTMYISKDRSRLVLLERKRSGSANASSPVELINQVHATKENFLDPATDFLVPNVWGDLSAIDVISAVYCKAGPDSLFCDLVAHGIYVVTDSFELLHPSP